MWNRWCLLIAKAAASTISSKMAMNLTNKWCNGWKRPAKWALVLRYVARFDANGKARVGVEAVRENTICWHHCYRAITSLPSKAAGIATTRW